MSGNAIVSELQISIYMIAVKNDLKLKQVNYFKVNGYINYSIYFTVLIYICFCGWEYLAMKGCGAIF